MAHQVSLLQHLGDQVVYLVTHNKPGMTIRQRLLKIIYPLLMKLPGRGASIVRTDAPSAPVPFHSLHATLIDGQPLDFSLFKGKKVLLVNTASECGYTAQLATLEKLFQTYAGRLQVLAFPSNDFKQQEKGSDADIASFCKKNYGLSFPVMKKTVVKKTEGQHPVFSWLSDPSQNGWNNRHPVWNFSKYLVDEQGRLIAFFGPNTDPFDPRLVGLI